MTTVEQPDPGTSAPAAPVAPSFADALRQRVEEAREALTAAEDADDPLLAQIAAGDLADLEALAVRNDVDV